MSKLVKNVLMPKEIAERSGIRTNHVSKVLTELKNKELIEIINPETRKGRIYRITSYGKMVTEEIKKETK